MNVELTDHEADILLRALSSYLSDLRAEIRATDNPQFRDGLKRERATLEGVAAGLAQHARRSA